MAEGNRSDKLKRLVAVQRHLERMAENELAETTRVRNENHESMDRVILAIGSLDQIHMVFSEQYAERFAKLTLRDQQLAEIQTILETQVMKERTKADRLQEHMLEARELEIREEDDNAIYDLIDQRLSSEAPASSKVQKR